MEKASGWLSEEELILHRMETFHRERVAALMAGQTPFKPSDNKLLILHVVPEESVRSRVRFSVSELQKRAPNLRPFGQDYGHSRINIDGLIAARRFDPLSSYTQLFRDGRLEAVMSGAAMPLTDDKLLAIRDQFCE